MEDMQFIDKNTIFIVVGSGIVPEEKDRPLAYNLRDEINRRGEGDSMRRGIVISDLFYAQNKILYSFPTIAIGGPGVNLITLQYLQRVPVAHVVENTYFIQYDAELNETHVLLWGMNQETTEMALKKFIGDYLEDYLRGIWEENKSGFGGYWSSELSAE
ncbi:MAG: hypothetical protein ACUVXI_06965 [bacterium]